MRQIVDQNAPDAFRRLAALAGLMSSNDETHLGHSGRKMAYNEFLEVPLREVPSKTGAPA